MSESRCKSPGAEIKGVVAMPMISSSPFAGHFLGFRLPLGSLRCQIPLSWATCPAIFPDPDPDPWELELHLWTQIGLTSVIACVFFSCLNDTIAHHSNILLRMDMEMSVCTEEWIRTDLGGEPENELLSSSHQHPGIH